MELQIINNQQPLIEAELPINVTSLQIESSDKCFIDANTISCTLEEIKKDHLIPVFLKDNEPLISHSDFIETMMDTVFDSFNGEAILSPNIRLSHAIKGRIPGAKNKPANELLEHEKTLYYERMAFIIEIPTVYDEIEGNKLNLMVGGVKSFSLDNLYNKKGSDEHFKIFIGFKNTVCTNLCVWTDGLMSDLKVVSRGQLKGAMGSLLENYNANYHMHNMRDLTQHNLSEKQFALLIGRLKMYPLLPKYLQSSIPPLHLGETQISTVVKDYFRDDDFSRAEDGNISLWRLYNLLTGANKSSYIDSFIEKSANAFHFTERIKYALMGKTDNWFLN